MGWLPKQEIKAYRSLLLFHSARAFKINQQISKQIILPSQFESSNSSQSLWRGSSTIVKKMLKPI
jgi:hypothetical protein